MSYDDVAISALPIPVQESNLLGLLWHKGSPWIGDIWNRMEGNCDGCVDRFWVARDGQEPVAHAWYTVAAEDQGLGLLGHVFTKPEYRRRGLSTRVIRAALADFRERGGRIMQLFTYNPLSVPFYEKLGFEQIHHSRAGHAADWAMRWPVGSGAAVDARFSPGPCRIRPLAAADLPQYCLLYNLEYETCLKDWAQQIALGLETELTFLSTMDRLARGDGVCFALENGQTIAGIATLMRNGFAPQSHLAAIDYYVHPRFTDHAGELFHAALASREKLGVEIVDALVVDKAKEQTIAEMGFRPRETLRNHYRAGGKAVECVLYEME